MNKIQKRFIGFLICIIARVALVVLSKKLEDKYLRILGMLLILPALGFMIIYLNGYRKTGLETQGDKIWWNDLRPIHATLYFMFAYYAINKNKNSYKILLFDVIFGTVAFLMYHYTKIHLKNYFNKLKIYFLFHTYVQILSIYLILHSTYHIQ